MPLITETFFARDRETWRAWLKKNGATKKEIWLVFYKKHTGQACVSYDEAVEEALCFGWIDGILRRIDEEKHTHRFTPRQPKSQWSELNRRRVAKMNREKRMTPAGRALVDAAKKSGQWTRNSRLEWNGEIHADLAAALAADQVAGEKFACLAPSRRKMFVWWICDAKKAETRARRIGQTVRRLALNEPFGW